jgi:hypothetical protein
MPIRRINSTGRKKLLRQDVTIFVSQDPEGVLTFDATLNLADYELPGDAKVFLEAYRQRTFMRFDYGTVQSPQSVADQSRRLVEFSSKDGLLFRVKVVSSGGLLLAEGDQIPIASNEEQDDSRIPLLPTEPEDLGQEVWCVDIGANGPILQVSKHLPDWKAVAASPTFRCLVFTSAMREILTHVVLIEGESDADDEGSWRGRWLRFARSLGVGEPPDQTADDSEKNDWIDAAVKRFSQHHQILNQYKTHFGSEATS